MKKLSLLLALLPLVVSCGSRTDEPEAGAESKYNTAKEDWYSYLGDPGGTHYSRLTQITRDNIGQLQEAWRYVTPDPGDVQTTPLIIAGTMYVVSPRQKVIALDAATGEEKWVFDSGEGAGAAVRSVTWWSEGDERRLFSAVSHYIYAINPVDGTAITGFGDNGRIDLHADLRGEPDDNDYHATSPAVIYRDLLILGGRVGEATPASPGDQRAYDVRSGKLRWSFHTVPMADEPGSETWPEGARETQGGANAWGGTTVDVERGIVFIGTGSPTDDFYGGERPGDNLYGDCLIALDANTGEKLWHFQAVRHDLWDMDFPAPPVLLTVTRDGKKVDAVAAANKAGYIYIFDRVSGEPLFPIVDQNVPATSTVPGEVPARTQPIPTLPAALNKLTYTRDELTTRTPEMHAWAQTAYDNLLGTDRPFTPLSVGTPTMVVPGWKGGGEWGGISANPDSSIIYINVNNWISLGTLAETASYAQAGEGERAYRAQCMGCHGEPQGGSMAMFSLQGVGERLSAEEMAEVIQNGRNVMPGFPLLRETTLTNVISFINTGKDSVEPARRRNRSSNTQYVFTGYDYFYDPEGYPAWQTPWATLNAIDMNTGEYLWTVPHGEYEELAAQGYGNTGAENHGGLILTATGLLIGGGTEKDPQFYAYDSADGKVLWKGMLPGYDRAGPATYAVNGKQFVVVAANPKPDAPEDAAATYVAFALPD